MLGKANDQADSYAMTFNRKGVSSAVFWNSFDAKRERDRDFAAEISRLPTAEQITKVTSALRELNRGIIGELKAFEVNDVLVDVTLQLVGGNVNLHHDEATHDLSPLRGFSQLKRLTLDGGMFWLDLSPLTVLQLEELNCREDIAMRNAPFLQGMKFLKSVNGQPTKKYFSARSTAVLKTPH